MLEIIEFAIQFQIGVIPIKSIQNKYKEDYTAAEVFGSWCGSITLSDSQAIFRLFDPTILERLVVSRIAGGNASRRYTNAPLTNHNLDVKPNTL